MNWTAYRIVFRLVAPMHIGWNKVGNVQRTHPYVVGRTMWGALTARIARDSRPSGEPATDPTLYQDVAGKVHNQLAYTYFYPALQVNGDYRIVFPWQDVSGFAFEHLGSYASTALNYPEQSAAETTLHEVEYLLPRTRIAAQPVFLLGYFFVRDDLDPLKLDWQAALKRIQLGGERSYGWGRVRCAETQCEHKTGTSGAEISIFDASGAYRVTLDAPKPIVTVAPDQHLLAHTRADPGQELDGPVEPLAGRIWQEHDGAGVDYSGMCYVPGSKVGAKGGKFKIGIYGVWENADSA